MNENPATKRTLCPPLSPGVITALSVAIGTALSVSLGAATGFALGGGLFIAPWASRRR
jgi:hypothetical protein